MFNLSNRKETRTEAQAGLQAAILSAAPIQDMFRELSKKPSSITPNYDTWGPPSPLAVNIKPDDDIHKSSCTLLDTARERVGEVQ